MLIFNPQSAIRNPQFSYFTKRFILFIILLILISPSPVKSQYVDFGRNKVQYNNFDWHTLSTTHFKVFFYPEMKELAEIGAAYAEDWYRIHQQDFNYSLADTVPLIFYASPLHFKETNTTPGLIPEGVGGFFEFIKGRVVIPYDGSLGNFKHVIGHELTHVFMTAKIANVLRGHRQNTERQPPLWFTEGLAEYLSTEWDPTAEMIIKDAVLNGYMVGLNDWERFYGTFLMYKMGQNACQYINETYGHEKILLLMENFWMHDDFSDVMEETIGKSYETFDKEWLYSLKKKYFVELTTKDDPSAITKAVFSQGFGHKPAYYKNGSKEEVYFIGNLTGYTSIYKINLSGGKPQLILEGEKTDEFEEFHFFRSGLDISSKGVLAFQTKKGGTDALHLYDIRSEKMIASYTFKNIVQIGSPSFSPDGNTVAFSAMDMGGKSDLYLFEISTKNLTRLTNDYFDDRDVSFSTDGKRLVFSSDRTHYGIKNRYNLFLYTITDNSIEYLTSGDQADLSPQFSKDGTKILFTSTATIDKSGSSDKSDSIKKMDDSVKSGKSSMKSGVQNVWLIDLTSPKKKMSCVTNYTTGAMDAKWAGDDKIVFTTYEKGTLTIRLAGINYIPDSIKASQEMIFSEVQQSWMPPGIKGIPKKNELKYEKQYSLDIATSNISTDPVFGTNAGGILAMSDVLGNDQYYFLVFNNSETGSEFFKSFNIAISRVSLEKRLNYAYGIFHLSGKRYDFGDDIAYFERNFGGYFAFSYPLSFFQRVDASITLANSKRDLTEDLRINRRALLLTNSLSYVRDNSMWGPTGPLDGSRFNLTLSYTTDVQFSNVNYYTVIFDYRRYFRINREIALASRFEFLMNEGKEARRWALGGSWDLRGYPRFSIRGRKLWFSSLELRFPLINIFAVHFPFGINFDFPYIRGAAFIDAGNAWDDKYTDTKGSIGVGARINIYNIIALRYDIGKRIENNFKHFQSGIFQQFFFGWDF